MRISNVSTKSCLLMLCCTAIGSLVSPARAVSSAELYTSASFPYGRFEARVQFAGGDGVVGSFFLWKDASEMSDVFWNELDLETVWGNCELFSNALYGLPEANHTQSHGIDGSWCTGFHTYAYEWTPDYTAWFVDGVEVRRDTGEHNAAFRDNADAMQIHFNVWPGDSTFGGNFSPAILPLFEYINWVQYSSYADGAFNLEWREDFNGGSVPAGWVTGNWGSPKNLSTHTPANVAFIDGFAVLSLTADNATGSAGAAPMDTGGAGPPLQPDDADDPPDDGMTGVTDDGMTGVTDGETTNDPEQGSDPLDDETPADDGEPPDSPGGTDGSPSGQETPEMNDGAEDPTMSDSQGGGAQPDSGQPAPTGPQSDVPGPSAPSSTGDSVGAVPGETTPPPGAGPDPSPTVAEPVVMESDTEGDEACSCRAAGSGPLRHWTWVALLGLSVGWLRRRIRK